VELTLRTVEAVFLAAIRNEANSYAQITALYHDARAGREPWDWERIDQAVADRFGAVGLEFMQARAAVEAPVVGVA